MLPLLRQWRNRSLALLLQGHRNSGSTVDSMPHVNENRSVSKEKLPSAMEIFFESEFPPKNSPLDKKNSRSYVSQT